MTSPYNTKTWWLPDSPQTHYHMEAMPHSPLKPITEDTTQNRRKGAKKSNEDCDKVRENKINSNSKVQNSVNSRMKGSTRFYQFQRDQNSKEIVYLG